jgi:biopolymer transport protein ExbD
MLLRRQFTDARNDHIDMTPMVDVVFQLMTFMLFTMQTSGVEGIEVPVARHGVGVDQDDATFLTLPPGAGKDGAARAIIGLGKGPDATPEQVRAAVAAGVREGRPRVVLQADGSVPHGEILRWAAIVTGVEGATLHIGVQEKP